MVWWQRSARQDQTPWNGYLVWWVVVVTFLPSCRHARRMLDSVMWLASANGSIADAALQKLKKCLCIWTLPLLLLFGTLRLPWEEAWFRGWDAIWAETSSPGWGSIGLTKMAATRNVSKAISPQLIDQVTSKLSQADLTELYHLFDPQNIKRTTFWFAWSLLCI